MRNLLALTLCAFLAACGGGGSEPEPVVTTPPVQVCGPVKIATFGDSTMSGDVRTKFMQDAIDAQLGAGKAIVENRAASGYAAFELLAGSDTVNVRYVDQLAITKPDVVLINHGLNDMAHRRTLEQYRADLDYLVTQAQARGAVVILQTQIPQNGSGRFGEAWRVETVKVYAQVMRDVAAYRKTGLVEVMGFVESVPDFAAHVPDGVHQDAYLDGSIYGGPVASALAEAARGKCGRGV